MVDASQRRELTSQLNRSHGSFELVLSPVILGVLGFLADRWMGTVPVLTVVAVIVGFAGAAVKIFYAYEVEMRAHEEGQPWARS